MILEMQKERIKCLIFNGETLCGVVFINQNGLKNY